MVLLVCVTKREFDMKRFYSQFKQIFDRRLKSYRLPLIAIVETIVFFALAIIADELWFGGDRFWNTQPHPFWLPVLLLTFQYGTGAGVLASVFAILGLFTGNYPGPSFNQDAYEYIFSLSKNPILWLLCAVVLGELRIRHLREMEALREMTADYKHKRDLLYDAYMHMHALKNQYEAYVRGQNHGVSASFRAAKKLIRTDERMVLDNVSFFLNETIKAKEFSIYLRYGEMLIPAMKNYSTQSHPEDFFSRPGEELITAVIQEKKILCIASPEDEKILAGEALFAGPLQDEAGRVMGLLKIESLEFNDLTVETIEIFSAVCECLGQALAVGRYYDNLSSGQVLLDHVNDESFPQVAFR